MFFLDLTNPITLVLMLLGTILLIFLAQEMKKSYIASVPLVTFLLLLITHVTQLITIKDEFRYLISAISTSVAIDFVFILISFFAYLWVDDIEAKATNKKSIDNSLDWFWKKI